MRENGAASGTIPYSPRSRKDRRSALPDPGPLSLRLFFPLRTPCHRRLRRPLLHPRLRAEAVPRLLARSLRRRPRAHRTGKGNRGAHGERTILSSDRRHAPHIAPYRPQPHPPRLREARTLRKVRVVGSPPSLRERGERGREGRIERSFYAFRRPRGLFSDHLFRDKRRKP